MPAIVVPAVILSAEEELSLFQITGDGRRHEAVDRQGVGLTNDAGQGERSRNRDGADPLSHEACPFYFQFGMDKAGGQFRD
jgi:hypothetical protein